MDILDNLSPEEKATLYHSVASPWTKRHNNASRKKFTNYLIKKYKNIVNYLDLINVYLPLLKLASGIIDDSNASICKTKAYKECMEIDRPKAVMKAIKKLNDNIVFTDIVSDKDIKSIAKNIEL